jgi:hypothetical protein
MINPKYYALNVHKAALISSIKDRKLGRNGNYLKSFYRRIGFFVGIEVLITKKGVVNRLLLWGEGYLELISCKPKSYEKKDYIFAFRLRLLYFLRAMGLVYFDLYCVSLDMSLFRH